MMNIIYQMGVGGGGGGQMVLGGGGGGPLMLGGAAGGQVTPYILL